MAISPQMSVLSTRRHMRSLLPIFLGRARVDRCPVYSSNLVIILGMMQVSKKIPFDDPNVLMGVRILYIVSNVLILGIYLYLQQQINKKKGTKPRLPSSSTLSHCLS